MQILSETARSKRRSDFLSVCGKMDSITFASNLVHGLLLLAKAEMQKMPEWMRMALAAATLLASAALLLLGIHTRNWALILFVGLLAGFLINELSRL